MAQVRLARARVDLLDAEVRADPARNLVLISLGPVEAEIPYNEALAYHQRLGAALARLRSVEFGPQGGDGVFQDVTGSRSSTSAS